MLFGAGNLVFPPFLGMNSGNNWFWGFQGYAIMDIIFAMIAMIIISNKDNAADGIVGILGNKLSKFLMFMVYLCIGPLVAIPRTAATTFGLSVETLFPQLNSIIFSIIFFGIVLFLSIKPSNIIDIIGSILAPVLLITIGILIIKGVLYPIGTITNGNAIYTSIKDGIMAGYQTMDTIAMLVFSIIIISKIKDYKLENEQQEKKMIRYSCLIAGTALFLIYAGLTYLGATASSIYPKDSNRTYIIVNLAKDILGSYGFIILAVIVASACLTTAIGLVSSCSAYFSKLFNQKISYKTLCVIICVFSAIFCNTGLEYIIAFAAPILDFIYPIVLLLIILSAIPEEKIPVITRYGAIISVTAFVMVQLIENLTHISNITAEIPLASYGYGWIIPAIIGLIIGKIADIIAE